MPVKSLLAVLFSSLLLSGCISTTTEVKSSQWSKCVALCDGKLYKAGLDWLNGEMTCTCTNSKRMRYAPEKSNDDY